MDKGSMKLYAVDHGKYNASFFQFCGEIRLLPAWGAGLHALWQWRSRAYAY